MRDLIKDSFKLLLLFVFGFILVSAFLIVIVYLLSYYPNIDILFDTQKEISSNILRFNAAAIIILTIFLICVAWLQLSNLNKTSRADFLLRIDDRYGRTEIIKARAIIQELYRKAAPQSEKISEEVYIQRISDGIKDIGQGESPEQCEKFAYLLNLLDYLESISYFANKNYISLNEIDELVGGSMQFYYKIFKAWIKYRQIKYDNLSYYCEFEAVIKKIESHQLKEKLAESCILIRILNYFR